MFIYPFNGKMPKIAASALIAPNVTIIGDVEFGEHSEQLLIERLGMDWDEISALRDRKVI